MKIGIITQYFRSNNYGGLLQAYALTKVTSSIDNCDSEQIQVLLRYPMIKTSADRIEWAINPLRLLRFVYSKSLRICGRLHKKKFSRKAMTRNSLCLQFARVIPHSSREYTYQNIFECATDYNLYITGSDQVWSYSCYKPFFFLSFTNAPKISYAASIGHSSIPAQWKKIYRDHLKDFLAVSVREQDAVAMIQPLSPVPVEWVLDPTLLLSASEWDEICSLRQVDGRYMFCYFLGDSKRDRMVAEKVAKKKGLRIVTLPHLLGSYRLVDKHFGDIQLWDIGPKEFVSLIKYADFVLTDSFHGSVFSTIYRRPFAAFERKGATGMGGRLKSLTDLTDTQERFLITPEMANADYICTLPSELPEESDKMRRMREKSINYLKRNIEAVRQKQEKYNS